MLAGAFAFTPSGLELVFSDLSVLPNSRHRTLGMITVETLYLGIDLATKYHSWSEE